MPLDVMWRLTIPWYWDRLEPTTRRRSPEEYQEMLANVGLTGAFWRLA